MATILTLTGFVLFISVTLFKDDTLQYIREDAIASYRQTHPEAEKMDEQAILKAIPNDDQALLDTIEDLSLILVLLSPIGYLLLLI